MGKGGICSECEGRSGGGDSTQDSFATSKNLFAEGKKIILMVVGGIGG